MKLIVFIGLVLLCACGKDLAKRTSSAPAPKATVETPGIDYSQAFLTGWGKAFSSEKNIKDIDLLFISSHRFFVHYLKEKKAYGRIGILNNNGPLRLGPVLELGEGPQVDYKGAALILGRQQLAIISGNYSDHTQYVRLANFDLSDDVATMTLTSNLLVDLTKGNYPISLSTLGDNGVFAHWRGWDEKNHLAAVKIDSGQITFGPISTIEQNATGTVMSLAQLDANRLAIAFNKVDQGIIYPALALAKIEDQRIALQYIITAPGGSLNGSATLATLDNSTLIWGYVAQLPPSTNLIPVARVAKLENNLLTLGSEYPWSEEFLAAPQNYQRVSRFNNQKFFSVWNSSDGRMLTRVAAVEGKKINWGLKNAMTPSNTQEGDVYLFMLGSNVDSPMNLGFFSVDQAATNK
ncbi:MAG: hypothetical protein WCG27_11760 [Pseudomonadota bacterium]